MRRLNAPLALLAAACLGASGAADAARWHVGMYWGVPGPYYYPYPAPVVPAPYVPYSPYYYAPYPPPVIVTPAQPDTTYIERPPPGAVDETQDEPPQGTWWYCDKTKTYYPYVKQCASGWRQVPATPPAPKR
ncbi:hypothetical protein C0Z18_11125 [Trinickia dabaoshanensis]|uniref:Lipoprotein n=1 Tax=Trinickia dabaoshanensis TaxID=564714 RepID=A0A2N7VTK1_9BURK|nr:hypothetical protein [Trinickia dabaoshanensis]PMS20481.1 hypothetical protein C0Z18_11125 [Trinickia dabaoshanensis]